ncbi:hypothetical protein HID58_062007, partial [Brassica napus]
MERVLRGSLITTRVQICAGSEAAVEDIDFSEFEDCSRVSVSFVCFVFSRNCLEFPFQGLGCPLSCLWRSCVQGSRLFLTRRRSFYWFSIGEYVRGCGGLRFGLSESSCLCGVVLETVKFPVVEVSSQPVSWYCPVGVTVVLAISFPNKKLDGRRQLISLISDGSVSLYFSLEAVVILCCGGTDVVVASYIFGEAAMTLRCGGSDVVVPSYFSSKVAAFLRRVGTDVVVVSYFPAKAAVILRCVGSDVVVASCGFCCCGGTDVVVAAYFSGEAVVNLIVVGLMWLKLRTFPAKLRTFPAKLRHMFVMAGLMWLEFSTFLVVEK